MQKGNDAKLVFDDKGRLVAIATGSDACTEHECGSKPLQSELCEQISADAALVAALKCGKSVRYPSLLETKLITKYPTGLQFITVPGKPPQAILGYAERPLAMYHEDLRFPSIHPSPADNDVVGAWDEGSFAIRVRTERYVAALTDFHAAMREGKVLFAGLFLKHRSHCLNGVILANREYLTDEDLSEVERAQREYESKLRLKAQDESDLIMREMSKRAKGVVSIGYVWAVWADKQESGVLYALNPGYQAKAAYYGPYTKEQLLAWADAQGSYRLTPTARAA